MPSSFNRKFEANLETFTDRISFKKILKEAVETPQQYDEHRIKVIYGHGGQGKTYLKRDYFVNTYLRPKAAEDRNLIFCDTIDFEHAPLTRSAENGLLCIAKELIEQGGMRLPAFTLAFLKLKQLNSLTSNLEDQYAYLYKITSHRINKGNIVDEVLGEIIDFAVGSGLAEMAGSIPLVGFFAKKMASKGKNKVLEWFRESGAGKILDGIDDMDRFELLEKLPMFLGWDVYKALSDSAENGIPKKRIVIVIDGYETLWSDGKNRDVGKDLWVRKLAEYMTGVLIVIFGREALRWHEIEKNSDVINGLEHIPIDGFIDEDANEYLSQVPIADKEIRAAIIQNAKGSDPEGKCSPLYLQLEAKTYENIINSGKVPIAADFAQGNDKTENEIFDRLFKHMDPSISNALGALSLSNYINEEIITLMEQAQAFATASVSMKMLREYSFILDAKDRLLVHGFVRDAAAEKYKENHLQRFLRVHEALFKYFDERLKFEKFTMLNSELEATIGHAAFHKKQFDKEGFPTWILAKARMLYGSSMQVDDVLTTQLHAAVDILEPADRFSFDSYSPELNFKLGQLFYQLAERYDTAVNRKASKSHIDLCITAYEKIYTKDALAGLKQRFQENGLPQEELDAIERYSSALAKCADIYVALQKNIEAGEFFLKVSTLCGDFNMYYDRNNYMSYLSSVGRFSEAEAFFFKRQKDLLEAFAKLRGEPNVDRYTYDSTLYSLSNSAADLARVLRMQGRFEEAKKYNKINLELMIDHHGPGHIYTAYAKHSLALTYVREGKDYDFSIKLLDEVREVYEQMFSKNHVYYGELLADYFAANKHHATEKALDYYIEAMRIFSNQSHMNREIVETLLNAHEMIATAMSEGEAEEENEAMKMIEHAISDMFYTRFEEMKNLFSVFHPLIHRGLRTTARILEKMSETVKADKIKLKALEFERLMNFILTIRADEQRKLLEDEEKTQAWSLFSSVMSLPADPASVIIEVSKLPFYRTFDLYKISFVGLEIPVARFVLSNMQEAWLIDHTNAPIYELGEKDFSLQTQHAPAYAMFFCDTTIGRHGRFLMLRDGNDIPWHVDSVLSESFKSKMASLIPKLKVVFEDDKACHLEGAVLFKDSIFLCKTIIEKSNGIVKFDNESLVVFYETENGDIGIIDEQNLPLGNYRTFEFIPASVDPIYRSVAAKESPKSFFDRIMQVFDIIAEDLVYVHPTIEKEGDEIQEFADFHKLYSDLRNNLLANQQMNLKDFKYIVIYNYNINVTVYNNYIKVYDASDQSAENLRYKMSIMESVLEEVDQYKKGQHEEQKAKAHT